MISIQLQYLNQFNCVQMIPRLFKNSYLQTIHLQIMIFLNRIWYWITKGSYAIK